VRYDGERLIATAIYRVGAPARELLIHFGAVQAFKVYEEFSDPWMESTPQTPKLNNSEFSGWAYPLQEVIRSRWIERILRRNGGLDGTEWRHYTVTTLDVTLHVMVAGDPENVTLFE
jgi:hypothetical protein